MLPCVDSLEMRIDLRWLLEQLFVPVVPNVAARVHAIVSRRLISWNALYQLLS